MKNDLPLNTLIKLPDMDRVAKCESLTEALVICQTMAGIKDKQLCGKEPGDIFTDPAIWSRIKSGEANFPHEKLIPFMDLCGNDFPLVWLAYKRKQSLVPMETEAQREMREKQELIERQRQELIDQFVRQIRFLQELLEERFKKAA